MRRTYAERMRHADAHVAARTSRKSFPHFASISGRTGAPTSGQRAESDLEAVLARSHRATGRRVGMPVFDLPPLPEDEEPRDTHRGGAR